MNMFCLYEMFDDKAFIETDFSGQTPGSTFKMSFEKITKQHNRGCINCSNCEECVDCINCYNCIGCKRCVDCKSCRYCEDAAGLRKQIGVKGVENEVAEVKGSKHRSRVVVYKPQ